MADRVTEFIYLLELQVSILVRGNVHSHYLLGGHARPT